jgi:hypothetical protein
MCLFGGSSVAVAFELTESWGSSTDVLLANRVRAGDIVSGEVG